MPKYLPCRYIVGYYGEYGHATGARSGTSEGYPGQLATNGGNIATISSTASATQITCGTATWNTQNKWSGAYIDVWAAGKAAL